MQEGYIVASDVQLIRQMREFATSVQVSTPVSVFSRRAQKLVEFIDKTVSLVLSGSNQYLMAFSVWFTHTASHNFDFQLEYGRLSTAR